MSDQEPAAPHEDLVIARLGPMNLLAPNQAPRHIRGAHGDLWQWFGSGRELISLTVAVRETQIGNARGVRDHALWEAERLSQSMDRGPADPVSTSAPARVPGSVGAAAAVVDGVYSGVSTHNRIVVTSDGQYMHVVHAMTTNTPRGRRRAAALVDDLTVTDWKESR